MSEKRKDSNGRILKTGESQRTNGTYQYRYKDIRKETKCVYAPTLSELRAKEAKLQRDLSDGIDYSGGNVKLVDLIDKHLEIKSQSIRPTTAQEYKSLFNTAKKYDFCYMPIDKIKQSDAKRWIISLKNDGLSYGSIKTIKTLIRSAFMMAVDDDLIRKNPMDFRLSSVLADDTKQKGALAEDEFNGILAFMMKSGYWRKYCSMAIIMKETGIRVSELCGLTYRDIDFENRTILINKQLKKTQNGTYYVESPKTKRGERIIPLSDKAVIALKSAIKERKSVKTEEPVDGHIGFIFLCKTGRPKTGDLIAESFQRMMNEYNEETGNSLVMTPHTLRHTFCTNLARTGMPVKDLQYLMGHADAETTMNTYAHSGFDSAKDSFYKAKMAQ